MRLRCARRYAASGCTKAASNCSRAQSVSLWVIARGGLTRMVWVVGVAQDAATARRAALAPSAASVRVKLDESEFRDLP
jgi:hypothetical protein